ncbi:RHS repeat-associated core domain-containing protein [Pseudomonas putida]|uniref:RHS repeat-associated core domain-containing protein n=1 Tax=Pseudomonas putida TaxID=303 RepID=UPI0009BF886C|nr:RHS repeat-associated core domain-containing protein [Pseudomonas putida]
MAYSVYGYQNVALSKFSLLGFNGEHIDAFTSGYSLGRGYRVYSPIQLRFHSPDSLSPFGSGGVNAYAYCTGDPVNASDPSGHGMLRRYNSIPSLSPRPRLRRNTLPDLQGGSAGLEQISHLPAMDKILSHLTNKDLVNLSQTSKRLKNEVGSRSLRRAEQLSDSMEILAAFEGNREGVLPIHALEMAKKRYPHYEPGARDLVKLWQTSREAESYQEPLTSVSAVIGPRGILGIRQGHQVRYVSPR